MDRWRVSSEDSRPEIRSTLIAHAIRYRLVTRFTSLVAVEEVVANTSGGSATVPVPTELRLGCNWTECLARLQPGQPTPFWKALGVCATAPELRALAADSQGGSALMKPLRYFVMLTLVAGVCLTGRAVVPACESGSRWRPHSPGLASDHAPRPVSSAVAVGDTHPVARLCIPRLNYDEIVLEGATPRTLAFGPARLLSGAALGEPGNLELAGHAPVGSSRFRG